MSKVERSYRWTDEMTDAGTGTIGINKRLSTKMAPAACKDERFMYRSAKMQIIGRGAFVQTVRQARHVTNIEKAVEPSSRSVRVEATPASQSIKVRNATPAAPSSRHVPPTCVMHDTSGRYLACTQHEHKGKNLCSNERERKRGRRERERGEERVRRQTR